MKKVFALLLICFIVGTSFAQGGGHAPKDTRTITECGFSSYDAAIHHAATTTIFGDGEGLGSISVDASPSGGWCYTLVIVCNPLPINLKSDVTVSNAPQPHDTRTVTQCGFSSEGSANLHAYLDVFIDDDENVQSGSSYKGADGKWCYSLVIQCNYSSIK